MPFRLDAGFGLRNQLKEVGFIELIDLEFPGQSCVRMSSPNLQRLRYSTDHSLHSRLSFHEFTFSIVETPC